MMSEGSQEPVISIPKYPQWGACGEEHNIGPEKACLYRGFLIHDWNDSFACVSPYIDSGGVEQNVDERIYTNRHITGSRVTRCRVFAGLYGHEDVFHALAFVDEQWAETDAYMARLSGEGR